MVQNGQKTGESDFNPDSMVQEHQKDISRRAGASMRL
jgi:hypothetical protein